MPKYKMFVHFEKVIEIETNISPDSDEFEKLIAEEADKQAPCPEGFGWLGTFVTDENSEEVCSIS
jgi:hypothetical protein